MTEGADVDLPRSPERRQVVSVGGRCEECQTRFALSFTQHKGQTIVSTQVSKWESV